MPHYTKSHGLGNDYIVIDPKDVPFEVTPDAVRLICDRNRGVGSDGILLVSPSDGADFGLRILNPDGSEAEKSGNGVRIFAKGEMEELGGTFHAVAMATLDDADGDLAKAPVKNVDGRSR